MSTASNLAKAARKGCEDENNCHKTVLHWLVKAGATITAKEKAEVEEATLATKWAGVLSDWEDLTYDKTTLPDAPVGSVVGFFGGTQKAGGFLQHSMVMSNTKKIAGVNNLNVIPFDLLPKKNPAGFVEVSVKDLKWNGAQTVGSDGYTVRAVDPDKVVQRIKKRLSKS